ncbi:hypothetical protein WA538_004108, partial [Blastocystis sp. DL]
MSLDSSIAHWIHRCTPYVVEPVVDGGFHELDSLFFLYHPNHDSVEMSLVFRGGPTLPVCSSLFSFLSNSLCSALYHNTVTIRRVYYRRVCFAPSSGCPWGCIEICGYPFLASGSSTAFVSYSGWNRAGDHPFFFVDISLESSILLPSYTRVLTFISAGILHNWYSHFLSLLFAEGHIETQYCMPEPLISLSLLISRCIRSAISFNCLRVSHNGVRTEYRFI